METLKTIALLNVLLTESSTIQKIISRMQDISTIDDKYVYVNIESSVVGVADRGNHVVGNVVSFGNCTPTEWGVVKRITREIEDIKRYS